MIVDGRNGAPALRSRYEHVRRLLPLPDTLAPELLVPLDEREITRYVLREWSLPTGVRRLVRNAVAGSVLRFTTLPDVRASVTVAQRDLAHRFSFALRTSSASRVTPIGTSCSGTATS